MNSDMADTLRDSMRVLVEMAPESPDLPAVQATRQVPVRSPLLITAAAFAAVVLVIGAGVLLVGGGTPLGEDLAANEPTAATLAWSRVSDDNAVFGGEGDQQIFSITPGGPGFVAVGTADDDAAVWTSPDGITWSRVPHDSDVFGGDGHQQMESVTVGGPGFVAVGMRFDEPDRGGLYAAAWTSPDGVNWTAVPPVTASDTLEPNVFGDGGAWMRSVTVGGPGLVAVGSDSWSAAVWTSPDGIAWTRVPHDPEVFGVGLAEEHLGIQMEMYSVAAGPSGLVAVGSGGPRVTWVNGALVEPESRDSYLDAAVWASSDGVTWTRVPPDEAILGGPGNQVMSSVVERGSGLVAVGGDEPNAVAAMGGLRAAVWTSTDGVSWLRVPHAEAAFGGVDGDEQSMSSVISVGSGLVAVGEGTVWTSSDGLVWARAPVEEAPIDDLWLNDVTAGGPGLIAVGSEGIEWTQWGYIHDAVVWTAPITESE